jgi:hypothetical protein
VRREIWCERVCANCCWTCAERAGTERVVEARRRGMVFFMMYLSEMAVPCMKLRDAWRISGLIFTLGWRILGAVRVLADGCWEGLVS